MQKCMGKLPIALRALLAFPKNFKNFPFTITFATYITSSSQNFKTTRVLALPNANHYHDQHSKYHLCFFTSCIHYHLQYPFPYHFFLYNALHISKKQSITQNSDNCNINKNLLPNSNKTKLNHSTTSDYALITISIKKCFDLHALTT